MGDLPMYISCLSCFISIDAQLSLLDEHLLDLYIYYALIAMQSPQPKIRVAGISILSTITTCSSQHRSVVALVPSFAQLANDDWWEVQAQLLLLSSHLLSKITLGGAQDMAEDGEGEGKSQVSSPQSSAAPKDGLLSPTDDASSEDASDQLLAIMGRLFMVGNSKNVLQVGLSALVHLLSDYPTLLPMFVTVLLEQPQNLRQRLLRPLQMQADESSVDRVGRLTYVMGNASRMYEEKCVSQLWPHLDVAKTFVMQLEASPLDHWELEHMEVFLASLPETFEEEEAEEWLDIFEKVKQYVFVALVDPDLHLHSTQTIKRFWLCTIERVATRSIENSKKTLLQALRILYSGSTQTAKVDEAAVLSFLRELQSQGGMVQLDVNSVVDSFRETHPTEYASSRLDTLS